MNLPFALREYQTEFVQNLARSVKKHTHVLAQSPGGTGKTKTFVYIGHSANSRGITCLILTERIKVYNQNLKEAQAIGIGKGSNKYLTIEEGKLYVAMAQTLKNRQFIIDQFNSLPHPLLLIIDEAHIGTYSTLLDKLTNCMRIGFTATPHYKWAKHLPKFYKHCVTTHPITWFIENDFLCDYQHLAKVIDTEGLEIKNGEYTEDSQRKFFGTEEHYQDLFNDLRKTQFKKCMLFTASIKHCEEVYERLQVEGFRCSIIHSQRQDEAYQLGKFEKLNESEILVSVGSMTTGYDNPEVDLIVLYRATTSLPLYLQMMFRANRPKESMFFVCLDYGTNGKRLGPYFKDHDWETLWLPQKKKKRADGVAGVKICPNCESMIFTNNKFCKYCGAELPVSQREQEDELKQGIILDLTNKVKSLKGRRISSLDPDELATYAQINKKQGFCMRVAKARRLQEKILQIEDPNLTGNYLREFGAAMGYKPNWFQVATGEVDEALNRGKSIYFADITI